jgi:hypothetical protein
MMIGSMNKFVKIASFVAAVALVLSLSLQTSRVPNLSRKTSLIPRSRQALSRRWLQHFRQPALWTP